MPTQTSGPELVSIHTPMNDHGSMVVEVAETNETRHLVEYASDEVRETLAQLPEETLVPVEMVRAGSRSNVWKAVSLHGRTTPEASATVSTAN
ncbi:hypothetical protein KU306_13755 [Haloferax larsenii]|uniref:DUF7999 domain-containing protein n=1 Tax=Haloferax larsenii TaxID=302484 RepID=A0ABY5RED2_HALLR|nr:hypothetical protein [Haloferax larsenii]UVE49967.1 hypothetical protein KU306_13755 [Haloferax larsenii]